ncbi:MAG: alanine/ornithine racemase family PLP-dependent enzyme [Acidimicrobiales bacterium]
MTAPRLEVRLDRIHHNAGTLVRRLGERGVSVTGVTKATLGSPEIAGELVRAGVTSIGESRIENIEALRRAGVTAPMTLIRSPMLSQAARVVEHADVSLDTELDVLDRLSTFAQLQGRRHGVILMVELGDLREGILPRDLESVVRQTLRFPNLDLLGVGTNLACQSGVAPDDRNMGELSALASSLESKLGVRFAVVSGGNSANLDWVLGTDDVGRINDLRLGEAILLGCEPLRRRPIDGLHTDAFTLVAEVIEVKSKPTLAWGEINETAFGPQPLAPDRGSLPRAILALGRQDVDPAGLVAPEGMTILGASSDHLVVDPGRAWLKVGSEVRFQLDYRALLGAMTSPFVTRVMTRDDDR